MIANQPHAERNLGFERVAHGRRDAGIGHGNNNVRLDGMLARKQTPEHFTALVDGAAKNSAVRT